MPKVLNHHHTTLHVGGAYVGRPSIFGNPFAIGPDGTRDEVIRKYQVWFDAMLGQKRFRDAVEGLRGLDLACYCAPLACHADVILAYLERTAPPNGCPCDGARADECGIHGNL